MNFIYKSPEFSLQCKIEEVIKLRCIKNRHKIYILVSETWNTSFLGARLSLLLWGMFWAPQVGWPYLCDEAEMSLGNKLYSFIREGRLWIEVPSGEEDSSRRFGKSSFEI